MNPSRSSTSLPGQGHRDFSSTDLSGFLRQSSHSDVTAISHAGHPPVVGNRPATYDFHIYNSETLGTQGNSIPHSLSGDLHIELYDFAMLKLGQGKEAGKVFEDAKAEYSQRLNVNDICYVIDKAMWDNGMWTPIHDHLLILAMKAIEGELWLKVHDRVCFAANHYLHVH